MMVGWSEDLRRRLGSYLSKIVGLEPGMDGQTFEREIGLFLKCAAGLPSVRTYGDLGLTEMAPDRQSIERWFVQFRPGRSRTGSSSLDANGRPRSLTESRTHDVRHGSHGTLRPPPREALDRAAHPAHSCERHRPRAATL